MDDQTQITYIGKVDYRNKMTKFGIKPRDRTKHMYIIGKTGTGKSTFLENMIVQDIQNGHGVAFIDPHGGSADKLLDYIPEWRVNDVIYFNPSDMEYPVAFNPLEDPGPEKRHLVTDGLMSVFKKIWPEAFSGRMEYILNMTMMALMEYPDSTILSINRMLTDKDFRKKVVASVSDTAVRNAWDELMKWDDKRWSEAIGALVNKVGQFSTNPVIRNIIGQTKSTFDFRKAMDERKIVIINLSKGMIGEQNAPLLGAMLITKIYLSAMSRAELPAHVIERMPPFYFYVDEFQNFANESFASILSEARKYKLCLTVANQFIAQMEETIRDAVFGNMGTTISFRVGPLDAEFMERVFAPVFTQEDLQNIAFGQYYLTLQIDNMGSKPFSAQGLAPIPPLQTSMKTQVIEASRRNYASSREIIEAQVKEFFGYNSKKTIHSESVTDADGEIIVKSSPKSDVRMSGGTGIYIKPANTTPKPLGAPKAIIAEVPKSIEPQSQPKQQIFVPRPIAATPKVATPITAASVPVAAAPAASASVSASIPVVPPAPMPTNRAVHTPIELEEVPQPLPPITGYHNDDEPEASDDATAELSDSLSMLLNRLDNAVIADVPPPVVQQPEPPSASQQPLHNQSEKVAQKATNNLVSKSPATEKQFNSSKTPQVQIQKPAQSNTKPPVQVKPFQNKPQSGKLVTGSTKFNQSNKHAQAPVKPDAVNTGMNGAKKLDRAASTEQKSALQDVLARAMAQAVAQIPEKPKQEPLKKEIWEEAQKEVVLPPAWQSDPVVPETPAAPTPPVPPTPPASQVPVSRSSGGSVPPVPTPILNQPQTTQSITGTSRTIREVPEDILRRVLE